MHPSAAPFVSVPASSNVAVPFSDGQGGVAVGSSLPSQRLIAGRRDGMLTLHTEPV